MLHVEIALCASRPAQRLEQSCDPTLLELPETSPTQGSYVVVRLRQAVLTPSGVLDCGTFGTVCRLGVRLDDGSYTTSEVLAFTGDPLTPAATLGVTRGDQPGQFVLTSTGLAAGQYLQVDVCGTHASEVPLAPGGQALWNHADPTPSGGPSCLGIGDPWAGADPSTPVTVALPREFLSGFGWTDCVQVGCFLIAKDPVADVQAAAFVPFDPSIAPPPRPRLAVKENGPYQVTQTITVEVANVSGDSEPVLGFCRVDAPYACALSLELIPRPDGGGIDWTWTGSTWRGRVHLSEYPHQLGGCGLDDCYLELYSRGEGIPPTATVALPIDQ
jgi:hypothetical protein